jgi:hypothetical protein
MDWCSVKKKRCVRMGAGFIWFRRGPVAGSSEQGNELSGSKTGEEFLDQLTDSGFPRTLVHRVS